MPRHPPYTLKSLATFTDHRHARAWHDAGRRVQPCGCGPAARSVMDHHSPKKVPDDDPPDAWDTHAIRKDLPVPGGGNRRPGQRGRRRGSRPRPATSTRQGGPKLQTSFTTRIIHLSKSSRRILRALVRPGGCGKQSAKRGGVSRFQRRRTRSSSLVCSLGCRC